MFGIWKCAKGVGLKNSAKRFLGLLLFVRELHVMSDDMHE